MAQETNRFRKQGPRKPSLNFQRRGKLKVRDYHINVFNKIKSGSRVSKKSEEKAVNSIISQTLITSSRT